MVPNTRSILSLCSVMTLLFALAGSAVATPALDKPFTLVQPDGKKFIARQGGDEWRNWVSHKEKLIVQSQDSWWRYGQISDGELVAIHSRVAIDPDPKDAATTEDIVRLPRRIPRMPEGALLPFRAPARAPEYALLILVEFTDRTFSTTEIQWGNMFFGSSGKTVRNYFDEVSRTIFKPIQAYETWNIAGDGLIRVNLGYSHPDPGGTIGDTNRQIVYDALLAADPYINFVSFDTSPTDGFISCSELHIVTVVAGYERGYSAAWSPSVWGHRWALGFGAVAAPNLDGKTVCHYLYGGYMQDGELHGAHMATIGVSCHEMGHDLGLPDLYDTDASSGGIGGHGLMGYGGWGQAAGDSVAGTTPTHMCAWSKDQTGFAPPDTVSGNGFQTLYATDSLAYRFLKVLTSDANQYFLVENRQLSGYDAGLWTWFDTTSGGSSGGGLAIWHIDESISDNDNESHKRVDLEEANQGMLGYSELDGLYNLGNRHHYYYLEHMPQFGDNTTPNSRLYNGSSTDLDISSVSSAGPAMTFFIMTEPVGNLSWSTFLGHNEEDRAMDIAVDDSGYAYITGYTASDSFPTTPGAYQWGYNPSISAFVTKFNRDGSGLVYSTFLNGGSTDRGYGIAVDDSGYAYVTGYTYSQFFPTTAGAYDQTHNGNSDVFVTKLNRMGNALVYSTFIGGGSLGPDEGHAIAVDGSGNAYITGFTYCSDFPTTSGAFDRTHNGQWDAFVTKLNAAGSGLSYSTFLGGDELEVGRDISVDGSGYAYIAGWTDSPGFPTTVGAYDGSMGGLEDAFVTKVGLTGTSLAYSTFLGGGGLDRGFGIAVDNANKAYVTGWTGSSDFPKTTGAYDQWLAGVTDAFVTKFNFSGNGLDYSTYLGGAAREFARGITVDGSGNAYLTGVTESVDFPTSSSAVDTSFNGILDIFETKINSSGTGLLFSTFLGSQGTDGDMDWPPELDIDDEGSAYVASCTDSADFPVTAGAYDLSYNGGWRDAVVCKISLEFVDMVPPFAITDLSATLKKGSKTNGDVLLQWSQPYDNVGVTHYVIYRDTTASSLGDSLAGTMNTSYVDGCIAGTVGTNYFYTVKAVDAAGHKSEESNQVGKFDRSLGN